ncbi:hypothetical protein L686_02940 [Stutzerimonas stutzeri MF28]|nr:hypothetical protein L686_02940 [Stutzerimonas stutzeri MF28]
MPAKTHAYGYKQRGREISQAYGARRLARVRCVIHFGVVDIDIGRFALGGNTVLTIPRTLHLVSGQLIDAYLIVRIHIDASWA